jgi:hypothetical protein
MASPPSVRTWVTGETVTAADMNDNISDVLSFLLAPPVFQGRATSTQSVGNSSSTAVLLNAEDVDSAGGHSLVTNTSRYTFVYPGWYRGGGGVSYAANATGTRAAELFVNAAIINGGSTMLAAFASVTCRVPTRSMLFYGNVGDYLELDAFQNSGGALNTAVTTGEQPVLNLDYRSS